MSGKSVTLSNNHASFHRALKLGKDRVLIVGPGKTVLTVVDADPGEGQITEAEKDHLLESGRASKQGLELRVGNEIASPPATPKAVPDPTLAKELADMRAALDAVRADADRLRAELAATTATAPPSGSEKKK